METDLTKNIKILLWEFTNKQGVFGCLECTIGWFGNERVDYITYDTKGDFRCYEIKISVSDFHSKNHNSFVGNFNYYVFPAALYEKVKEQIPDGIGVLLVSASPEEKRNFHNVWVEKKPKRRALTIDIQILKNSMIRSLCRDVDKHIKDHDTSIIKKLQKQNARLLNENRSLKSRNVNLIYEINSYKYPERYSKESEDDNF